MLLLKKTTFEVSAGSPLVAEAEAGVLATADQIVAAAEAEAAKIREDAKAAYEQERKRGYDDGIAEGKQEILMQKLDLIDESINYMESVEGRLSDIVVKALKRCVAEIGDREIVCQVVKKAMQAVVRNQRQITVKVAPSMVPEVKSRMKTILADFPSLAYADVVEDAHLTDTACVVETEAGLVEASVEGQLAAIEKSIRKNFSKTA